MASAEPSCWVQHTSWSLAGLLAVGAVGALFLLRYVLDRAVFQHFARWCLLDPDAPKKILLPDKKKLHDIDKFCESCWKCFMYCLLFSSGALALRGKAWVWDTRQYWEGWPQHAPSAGISTYYALELSFYAASTVMLAFWEERRRDYPVMMLHHVVSVFLIGASYVQGFTRVGAVVMLLHDPSDIFLEGAKLCDMAGLELPVIILFALLLTTWGILRLVVLPFWIIHSMLWELPRALGGHQGSSFAMSWLACLLVVLHAYWFHLIVRIALDFVRTGTSMRDVRESKD